MYARQRGKEMLGGDNEAIEKICAPTDPHHTKRESRLSIITSFVLVPERQRRSY